MCIWQIIFILMFGAFIWTCMVEWCVDFAYLGDFYK